MWARRHVRAARAAGPVPRYGTPEWSALPEGDPRRAAAILIAAECWRTDDPGGLWAAAVRGAERDGARAAERATAEAEWRPVQASIRELLRHMDRIDRARAAGTDDYRIPAEERRRRALTPRPGDHPGGPVPWHPAEESAA